VVVLITITRKKTRAFGARATGSANTRRTCCHAATRSISSLDRWSTAFAIGVDEATEDQKRRRVVRRRFRTQGRQTNVAATPSNLSNEPTIDATAASDAAMFARAATELDNRVLTLVISSFASRTA